MQGVSLSPEPTMNLYQIRPTFANTSELEPTYIMARHPEEAAILYFKLCTEPEEGVELNITLVANQQDRHAY